MFFCGQIAISIFSTHVVVFPIIFPFSHTMHLESLSCFHYYKAHFQRHNIRIRMEWFKMAHFLPWIGSHIQIRKTVDFIITRKNRPTFPMNENEKMIGSPHFFIFFSLITLGMQWIILINDCMKCSLFVQIGLSHSNIEDIMNHERWKWPREAT